MYSNYRAQLAKAAALLAALIFSIAIHASSYEIVEDPFIHRNGSFTNLDLYLYLPKSEDAPYPPRQF